MSSSRARSSDRIAKTLTVAILGLPLAFCARTREEPRPVAERPPAEAPRPAEPRAVEPLPAPVEPPRIVEGSPSARPAEKPQPSTKARRPGPRVTEPVEVARVQPQYPEICKRHGIEGIVTVRAKISKRGEVDDVELVNGIHPLLDGAALRAVKLWRYRPGTVDGHPVPTTLKVKVGFRL